MKNVTIDPIAQNKIIDALPNKGIEALEVMAQLTANMLLSVPDANFDVYVERLKCHFDLYKEQP